MQEQKTPTITIKDIAREAGVSIGTASNVLNGLSTVTEKNRTRVLEAVERLQYRPNQVARMLRSKRSRSLGLIIPDISNPYYSDIARGVEDAASELAYTVFLCNADRSAEKERSYLATLSDKSVDGVILFKPQSTVEEMGRFFDLSHLVLLDADPLPQEEGPYPQILNCDDYTGVQQALGYLYERGHRRIAYIAGLQDARSSRERLRAYREFMQSHGLPAQVQQGRYDWQSGHDCAAALLAGPNRPTALFCANDMMALGALHAAHTAGLQVPRELAVMGHDDIFMSAYSVPPLTTVSQVKYEYGRQGARLLLGALGAGDYAAAQPLPPNRLLARGSA